MFNDSDREIARLYESLNSSSSSSITSTTVTPVVKDTTPVTHSNTFINKHIASLLKSEQNHVNRQSYETFKAKYASQLQSIADASLFHDDDAVQESMRKYRMELDREREAKLNEAKSLGAMIVASAGPKVSASSLENEASKSPSSRNESPNR